MTKQIVTLKKHFYIYPNFYKCLRCPVHTYVDIFENGGFFVRFGVASTRKRRFRQPKTEVFEIKTLSRVEVFENAVFVFTCGRAKTKVFENDDVMIGSSPYRDAGFVYVFKMADQKCMAILLGLISSLIACIQLHVTMLLNVHGEYLRKRINIMKMFSVSTSQKIVLKRLKEKPARPRRFWVRPGRTSAWWDNFASQTVVPEEWRENLRMSRESVNSLAEELKQHYHEGSSRCCEASSCDIILFER